MAGIHAATVHGYPLGGRGRASQRCMVRVHIHSSTRIHASHEFQHTYVYAYLHVDQTGDH